MDPGTVVEVYPAAALRRCGLPWRKYKGRDDVEERRDLVASFAAKSEASLSLAELERRSCENSDDAFDALIAACVARAVALGDRANSGRRREAARREGWIALPQEGALSTLGGEPDGRVSYRLWESLVLTSFLSDFDNTATAQLASLKGVGA
jgi:predicted nuclease with RNAse H fold